MAKKQRMRWSPQGAHRVAVVRAAVLDGRSRSHSIFLWQRNRAGFFHSRLGKRVKHSLQDALDREVGHTAGCTRRVGEVRDQLRGDMPRRRKTVNGPMSAPAKGSLTGMMSAILIADGR